MNKTTLDNISELKVIGTTNPPQKAINILKKKLDEFRGMPEEYWALISCSIVYNELNDTSNEISYLEAAFIVNPREDLANLMLGEKLSSRGDLVRGLSHLLLVKDQDDRNRIVRAIFERLGLPHHLEALE